MKNEQKPRSTNIDPDICEAIQALADEARRSFCGQVNYLLQMALQQIKERK